jgi:SH3-like domain-containing protein
LSLALWMALAVAHGCGTPAGAAGLTSSPTQVSSSATSNAPAQAPPNAVSGADIVQTALRYLGYRYTTTGNSPQTGFSCIGFVSYVYRVNGIPLPDDLALARSYAASVPFTSLLPGDVLFFQNTIWTGLSHTGIYIGGGRFIHAEWYNRGVVISSFNGDPVDGNYWIGKYLGANRPWSGPADTPVTPPAGNSATQAAALSVSSPIAANAAVAVPALNLRAGPSKRTQVLQVLRKGTPVSIVDHSGVWDRIQLANGTDGWSVAAGLSTHGAASGAAGSARAQIVKPQPRFAVASVPVIALRMHTAPAISAPVLKVLRHGQSVEVLQVTGSWARVRLPGGALGWLYGWVYAKFLTIAAAPLASVVAPSTHSLTANVRVHRAPGLRTSVILVARVGTKVAVLGTAGGWAHVRLPSQITGYVYGEYVR